MATSKTVYLHILSAIDEIKRAQGKEQQGHAISESVKARLAEARAALDVAAQEIEREG